MMIKIVRNLNLINQINKMIKNNVCLFIILYINLLKRYVFLVFNNFFLSLIFSSDKFDYY